MRLSVSASLVVAVTTVYFVIPTDAQIVSEFTRVTPEKVNLNSVAVFNCRTNGTAMLLYAPPIINENQGLNAFSFQTLGQCNAIADVGISCILFNVEDTMGYTATLMLSTDSTMRGTSYTVFCDVSDNSGNTARNSTTFTVNKADDQSQTVTTGSTTEPPDFNSTTPTETNTTDNDTGDITEMNNSTTPSMSGQVSYDDLRIITIVIGIICGISVVLLCITIGYIVYQQRELHKVHVQQLATNNHELTEDYKKKPGK